MSRRPEVELSDRAARYVERHPGVVERLAQGLPDEQPAGGTPEEAGRRADLRARIRARQAEIAAYLASEDAGRDRDAFLKRYGIDAATLR